MNTGAQAQGCRVAPIPAQPLAPTPRPAWPSGLPCQAPALVCSMQRDPRIEALLARMTPEEKAGQLSIFSDRIRLAALGVNPDTGSGGSDKLLADVRAGKVGALFNGIGAKQGRDVQRVAVEETRLSIPLLFGADVIHGLFTVFPLPLAEAASFEPELAERTARATAVEATAMGIQWTFAPMVDVARDQRWGRVAESSGEDTYLGVQFAVARVRGFQGPDLTADDSLLACPKHFAAYGAVAGGMDYNYAELSEAALRDVHLPAFKASFDAGALTVMSAFNDISGVPSSANRWLMTDLLRGEWHFRGLVVSDFTADLELIDHGYAADGRDAAKKAALAGLDMSMESGLYNEHLPDLVAQGEVPQEAIDEGVRRVLTVKAAMGLFDNPYRSLNAKRRFDTAAHHALARDAARRSIVLLKNDGVLPIRKGGKVKTIALVGSAMIARSLGTEEVGMGGDYYSGGGSGHCFVPGDKMKPPLEHLSRKAAELGISVIAAPTNNAGEARAAVSQADLTIVLAATTAEEGRDRDTLSLDGQADSLIFALMYEKPTVVLMQVPGTILMPWHSGVSAAALMFLGGEHTGSAWASVVFGEASPSGKLPLLIPATMAHVVEPALGADAPYSEGIFSSYRSEEKRKSAIFAFGHGLSYTNFTYGKPVQLPAAECAALACVRVAVSNAGGAAGAEVAQAYVELPPEAEAPKLMLRGFHKTAVLEPGAGETVTFNITARDLSAFLHGGWQLQKAAVLHVGASSADLRHSVPLAIPS
mmetsp:Transcript_38304/g.121731  ORF Transcript_38304/g.121731 Transcript_38304/m.121731 type:complete len:761 (+) Transcript_38304:2-2284(+)